ncbi:GNAT family N-acetyltransferase [Paenibacillus protaetiae]|uniref:GNAT family N-acetyltransferase n=1 Tax=Paenibacillus protaetiae TaxID=2509456 RepID=A0A4V0YEZ9_9BACL|nr:GNAT family N-acetyltransferase [Paenibacillus protaetiae]QAY65971.1 GNAT family N-acetyltransferase [Paenibacillus protaetiae]
MADRLEVATLLEQDVLLHLSLLKMIESYEPCLDIRLVQEDGDWGVLLLLPTEVVPYDRSAYPSSRVIVFIAYSSDRMFERLAGQLPVQEPAVYKLQSKSYAAAIRRIRPLLKMRSFTSYTVKPGAKFEADSRVAVEHSFQERLMPLWASNGYGADEVQRYFRNGAYSCSVYVNGEPVSTCLVFPNYKHVWEIGAVRTLEQWRGAGFAKAAVSTALHLVLAAGYTPRYLTLDTNEPSVQLAQAIGLVPFMTMDHYQ